MSDVKPKFSRGRKMHVLDGTGFGFYVDGNPPGGTTRYLMSGKEAQNSTNIIALIEALKGRKATADEISNVE